MMNFLNESREKWREVPAGGDVAGRIYSTDLLAVSDIALVEHWHKMDQAGSDPHHRGWYQILYRETFINRRVVEVGSGLGFDGIYFMKLGARWIFTDIVKDNLAIVKRLVDFFGLSAQAEYLWIEEPETLNALIGNVDVVWANGSLHHAPFDIARKETKILLQHLTPGGRWIELFYPYERWVRQGKLPFSEWGKVTDGDRTPWAEWHDLERIKQRLFPASTVTVLDYRFGGGQYGWIDLRVEAPINACLSSKEAENIFDPMDVLPLPIMALSGSIKRKGRQLTFQCTERMWDYACALQIGNVKFANSDLQDLPIKWALDIEIFLTAGSVGLIVTGENLDNFLGRELIIDAKPFTQRLTLTTEKSSLPQYFLIRNAAFDLSSSGTITSCLLRPTV